VLNRPALGELREAYRRMVLVRRLEEELGRLHREGRTRGPIHRCDGQEAVGIGATAALEPEDIVTSSHRGHAHYIGKGVPLGPLVAEILGRATGACGGRAGHMLVADPEAGVLGGCGIVGGMLPVAVGQAFAFQVRGEPRMVCAFLGDGAAQIGAAHEAMNLAGLWRLPVVFLIEANGFGLTVPTAAQSAVAELATRAAGYGMPGRTVDGNDVRAVFAAVAEAAARARRGDGPSLIEARTWRLEGFSTSDLGGYQDPAEVAAWRARDPIARLRGELLPELGESALLALEGEAERELGLAIEAALAAPPPPAEALAAPEYPEDGAAPPGTASA
jgi:pyruvate dehydrogenase E1 component alpha subunit